MSANRQDSAIVVDDVTKLFRIYKERNQSLKQAMLKGRRAKFEEFRAVDGVSFEVPRGTTFGLVGSNGSGKSTLLKCIAGILEPNEGAITTNGRLAAMLEVGSGFHGELSGRENIFLNAAILGMSRQEIAAKVDSIIEFSGVERFIDTPVKNYSSGMYVRLGFSVAIHTEPDILVVDEVFSVGDAEFQAKARGKFDELKSKGTTIALVSHSMGLVRSFCDQVAWLDHGKLVAIGSSDEVIDQFEGKSEFDRFSVVPTGGSRRGSGEAQITEIRVFDDEGEKPDQFPPGSPLHVELVVDSTTRIENPQFAFAIMDNQKRQLFRTTSEDRGWMSPPVPQGRSRVRLSLDSLPLGQGRFLCNAELRDGVNPWPIDEVVGVADFYVDRGDYWSKGSPLHISSRFESLESGTP